jgi:hypothetical protein
LPACTFLNYPTVHFYITINIEKIYLYKLLRWILKSLKIDLKRHSKDNEIVFNKNKYNDIQISAVLSHEIAHEELHYDCDERKLTEEIVELEAEAVSFLVSEYFKIDNPTERYLALYKKSYDLLESFKRINRVSSKIINGILELI